MTNYICCSFNHITTRTLQRCLLCFHICIGIWIYETLLRFRCKVLFKNCGGVRPSYAELL